MSTKYKATNVDSAYFITITTVDWVDLFTRQNHKNLIIESLKYCQREKGLEIYAYVLMPSHLHMMCRAINENQLSDIMRDFKKYTAKALVKQIKEEPESRREWLLEIFSNACANLSREQVYKVWQDGYHAKELFSNNFIYEKLNYIHQNPVQAGIVMKPEEYMYSSARNYSDMESIMEVIVINHAYFDMGPTNWSQAESLVGGSVDEMWKINKKFIDNRKALGNDFYLSHDPTNPVYYKGFYKMEIDYLTTPVSQGGLGGTMNNLGNNLWKVTW